MNRLALALLLLSGSALPGADWPRWRGPDRSNVSEDKGLLKEWPKDGPPLAWKIEGLGQGVPSVAVAGGRIFALGYKDGKEYLGVFAEKDGKAGWSTAIGPEVKEQGIMRWLSQRTPTVDGDRVYAFTAAGVLICLGTADGEKKWSKDYVKDFGGKAGQWGYCDFPLVDGDKLICTPGGKDSTVVALDKKTGETQWKCAVPGSTRGTYGGIVAAEIAGIPQYVHQLEVGVVGIGAKDGKLLWHYPKFGNSLGNVHTAIVRGDEVFCSCGWTVGIALLKIEKSESGQVAQEVYRFPRVPFDNWIGSPVRLGDRVHSANGIVVEWKTGKQVEQPQKVVPMSRVAMVATSDRLIHRTGAGAVTLAEVSVAGIYERRGEFKDAPKTSAPTWTFPIVANGHLYLRDQDALSCYDLRAPKPKDPKAKEPDAIYVPTPSDVVEKMLELAAVKKDDILYDLGSGDGRIVIAAAKARGCRAIGVEIDAELVAKSRDAARDAGVTKLAAFEQGDLFDADFTRASVVALYILPEMSRKLIPKLDKLKAGSRIVSHAFAIPGIVPDKVLKVTSAEDDVERPVYLYTIPLTKGKSEGR